MRKALITGIVSLAIIVASILPSQAKEPVRIIDGRVTKISDGDTIQVTDLQGSKVKIRFYGIDCPETEKTNKRTGQISKPGQPFGEEAYQALRRKLQGQSVRLEIMSIDQYQRLVSVVYIGNRNINREMVAEGWAWSYRQYLDRPHASEYIQAEEQARQEKKGLWQQNNPESPWNFRKTFKDNNHNIALKKFY